MRPMLPKIEGSKCGGIRCLRPVFREWIKGITEIAEEWEPSRDAPWWYNERASLSVFAGAVWRAGGFCFEEYRDEKRATRGKRRRYKRLYSGRVDIYFSWAGFEFIGEAKYVWSGFSQKNAKPSDRLTDYLYWACRDIRRTHPHGQRRLGILFAMPYFRKQYGSKINQKLDAWVDMLGNLETSAYAWVFPRCARYLSYDGKVYPGVAVLIREIG